MKNLHNGEFFGQTNEMLRFDGLTITDTEYTHPYVDWHYHENAYFTFLLQGNMTEGNKKEIYDCPAGTLLYHHWEDAHYNIKPDLFTRGFHLEVTEKWFEKFQLSKDCIEGSFNLKNPALKLLMYRIFRETKLNDPCFELSVHELLLNIFCELSDKVQSYDKKPGWVRRIDEILHENFTEKLNLTDLSTTLDVHPVHLSRDFQKHFHCSMGEYVRKLKVNKSLTLLNTYPSLTELALDCGFADQSHFIRSFKEHMGITPLQYKKLLMK
ncbi:AraC family transcriptional regulator [Chryseobacterium shigense]|uniref:Transcriptional regulator, AraC family n=1 Tax=Chryseobacterium shigense TaxID=297244 RepID=A0A1N7ILG8_9FLAO|nr:AraC family transcriptional regulator [Chryseobacterium shigense]PQA95807.1 AraC family transcriptional regulator [Chryseobacterium shigense]SIS37919.1 transcriptional regulator, AraC family [Chryseobacterium shigense]